MRRAMLATLGLVLALSACEASTPSRRGRTPAWSPGRTAITPTGSAKETSGPPELPRPVLFVPRETISRGDLSLFFLDPATGAAEGWGKSSDGRCAVRGTTGDARKLLFDCKRVPATTPSSGDVTYALDLTTGTWTPLPPHATAYGIITPDGEPLAAAAVAAVGSVLAGSTGLAAGSVTWSRDGSAFVLITSRTISPGQSAFRTYLVRTDSDLPVHLVDTASSDLNPGEQIEASWAPDGSRFALVDCCDQRVMQAISVFDAAGRKLWSRPAPVYDGNPRWSPDSRWLGVQVFHSAPSTAEPYPSWDLLVFNGGTGAPAFRLRGAIACQGRYWTADSRLVVGQYAYAPGAEGDVVVDPRSRTLFALGRYVTPSPTNPDLGIAFDGSDFYAVNLDDGSTRLIAHTTVSPSWDFLHEPLFAGSRIVFRPHELGHGGCGEGPSPSVLPKLELQFPPFPD